MSVMRIRQNAYRETGFTLPEMIVVIVVLTIIYFGIMLYVDPSYAVQVVIDQLTADLRYTQNLAMTRDDTYYFSIDSNRSYSIRNSAGIAQLHPYTHVGTQSLANGAWFSSTSDFPNGILVYDNDGHPYQDLALTLPLTNMASLCIKIGGASSSAVGCVYVNPQTGYVE